MKQDSYLAKKKLMELGYEAVSPDKGITKKRMTELNFFDSRIKNRKLPKLIKSPSETNTSMIRWKWQMVTLQKMIISNLLGWCLWIFFSDKFHQNSLCMHIIRSVISYLWRNSRINRINTQKTAWSSISNKRFGQYGPFLEDQKVDITLISYINILDNNATSK